MLCRSNLALCRKKYLKYIAVAGDDLLVAEV